MVHNKSQTGESQARVMVPWLLVLLLVAIFTGTILFFQNNKSFEITKQSTELGDIIISNRVYSIFYTGGVFSPSNLNIKIGDTVIFRNLSDMQVELFANMSQEGGLALEGKIIEAHGAYPLTFVNPGVYPFENRLAKNEVGSIIVK